MNLFKDDLLEINETLFKTLKKEVLYGELLTDLNTAISKLYIQMTISEKKMDFIDPADITAMFNSLTNPAIKDPSEILAEDKKRNEKN